MTLKSKTDNTVSSDDLIVSSILKMLQSSDSTPWIGTMTELKLELASILGKKESKMLPGSASALRVSLNRVINRLRSRKVSIKFGRTPDHMRTRFVKLVSR